MTFSRHGLVIWVALSLAACKGKTEDKPSGTASTSAPAKASLATAGEPSGVTWKKITQPFGTIEAPDGYELVDNQLEGKDGTVIMLQSQDGIAPEQIDDYLASYDEVQKRDAPKYAGVSTTKGTLGGAVAARVEGTFDNGTAFVTRDFLVFTKGKVVLLGSRTPKANAAALPGVIDHVARSLVVN